MAKGIESLRVFSHVLLHSERAVSGTCVANKPVSQSSGSRSVGDGGGEDLGFPSDLQPPPPGALLTWLLKERGSVSSVLDPELSGQQGCAPSAGPHLALSAPDPAATRGTCRPYKRRGEAVVGSGAASPRSPARRGEAELFKGLPEAERGNWHSIGPEHPGTLALPAPSFSS